MFDSKTIAEIGYYVYILVNPIKNEPFYVGKGSGNRVFHHALDELDEDDESLKSTIIKSIRENGKNVKHVIVRHGLTEEVAFEIESALIDIFKYLPMMEHYDNGNLQGGVDSIERGLMTTNEIIRLYNAEPLDEIPKNCMIININRSYKRSYSRENDIYIATKEIWRLSKNRLKSIEYVLSEYKGRIVEVFKVNRWYKKRRYYNKGSQKYGQTYFGYGFDGEVAPELIREKYINKSIAHHKKRGSANVVRYSL